MAETTRRQFRCTSQQWHTYLDAAIRAGACDRSEWIRSALDAHLERSPRLFDTSGPYRKYLIRVDGDRWASYGLAAERAGMNRSVWIRNVLDGAARSAFLGGRRANWIRALSTLPKMRSRAGVSRKELAARVGVRVDTIEHIESGVVRPRTETLYCLAEALDIPIDRLYPFA